MITWDDAQYANERFKSAKCSSIQVHMRDGTTFKTAQLIADISPYHRAYCNAWAIVDARGSKTPRADIIFNLEDPSQGISRPLRL